MEERLELKRARLERMSMVVVVVVGKRRVVEDLLGVRPWCMDGAYSFERTNALHDAEKR